VSNQQDIEFLICQYADGALEPQQAREVEALLAADPHYQHLLQQHRALNESLNDWASRIPMVDWNALHDQLSARLRKSQARPALQRNWMRAIAAAAAIALIATVLMFGERQRDSVSTTNGGNNGVANVSVQSPSDISPVASVNPDRDAVVTVHEQQNADDVPFTLISVHRDTFDATARQTGESQSLDGQTNGSASAMADFSSETINGKQNVHP